MKTKIYILLIIFNLASLFYLLIPIPNLVDLPNSVKSAEPGDTVQLKNVSAYYTNLSRTEVINFYKSIYHGPLIIHLNHPPELAKTIFRDTMQSYYLEEFYLPFKGSLYINGYEWENDVFTVPEKRIKNKLSYLGIDYPSKITVRTFPTSIPQRLIAFFGTELSLIAIFYIYKKFLKTGEK